MHGPEMTVFTTNNPTASIASLWLLVNAFAVYRLAHLVARDTITEKFRARVGQKYHGSLVTLINCQWCLSFWFSLIAIILMYFDETRPWWLLVCVLLSLSAVAGMLAEKFG